MNSNTIQFKTSALCAAIVATLGSATPAAAETFTFSVQGVFTLLDPGGVALNNPDTSTCLGTAFFVEGKCLRTPIAGIITYDDVATTGTMTITAFSFFGSGGATATTITFQRIGDGFGGPGTLVLGNMGFNWNGNTGIPVSTVTDGQGFFGTSCLGKTGGLALGNKCSNAGAIPADDAAADGSGLAAGPIGKALLAMTTFNTTNVDTNKDGNPGPITLGDNPSGTLPLVADPVSVGGSPMRTAPFPGFNANFDFTSVTLFEKGGVFLQGPPKIESQTPKPKSKGAPFTTNLVVTFDRPVVASTVVGNFTLMNEDGEVIDGTVKPTTGITTQFIFDPTEDDNDAVDSNNIPFDGLAFKKTYTATLGQAIQSASPPLTGVLLGADVSWKFTVQGPPTPQVCSGTVAPYVSVGSGALTGDSNFTMLVLNGNTELGTNDVRYDLDTANLNDSETGTIGLLTNELASNTPYRGFIWTAHHIRLFEPGSYNINVDCSTAQLVAGTCLPNANPARNLSFTVPAGHIGAHMLFDWNGNLDIDVVNVWAMDAKFDVAPDGFKNDLNLGGTYGGLPANGAPLGNEPDPQGLWDLASTDADGNDGINGMGMLDGPFKGFHANFNLGPKSTCTPAPPPVSTAPNNALSNGFFGCRMTDGKVNPWQRADLGLLAGFLGALAFWRRRNRTNA